MDENEIMEKAAEFFVFLMDGQFVDDLEIKHGLSHEEAQEFCDVRDALEA